MEPTRKRIGRPPEREGEIMEQRMMRWPPSLWRELEELVPDRQRSRFIRRAVEKALAAERRRQAKATQATADQAWEAARRDFDSEVGDE